MLKALIMGRYRAALDEGAATLFRWDINCALLPPDPPGTTSSIRVEFVKPDPRLIEDDGRGEQRISGQSHFWPMPTP